MAISSSNVAGRPSLDQQQQQQGSPLLQTPASTSPANQQQQSPLSGGVGGNDDLHQLGRAQQYSEESDGGSNVGGGDKHSLDNPLTEGMMLNEREMADIAAGFNAYLDENSVRFQNLTNSIAEQWNTGMMDADDFPSGFFDVDADHDYSPPSSGEMVVAADGDGGGGGQSAAPQFDSATGGQGQLSPPQFNTGGNGEFHQHHHENNDHDRQHHQRNFPPYTANVGAAP